MTQVGNKVAGGSTSPASDHHQSVTTRALSEAIGNVAGMPLVAGRLRLRDCRKNANMLIGHVSPVC